MGWQTGGMRPVVLVPERTPGWARAELDTLAEAHVFPPDGPIGDLPDRIDLLVAAYSRARAMRVAAELGPRLHADPVVLGRRG